ncbi:MAG: hypothetical protein ABGZ17_12305 [Planctomycetaceae bacterium]
MNNVIYNWSAGSNATQLFNGAKANVINCAFLPGGESRGGGVIGLSDKQSASRVFVAGMIEP